METALKDIKRSADVHTDQVPAAHRSSSHIRNIPETPVGPNKQQAERNNNKQASKQASKQANNDKHAHQKAACQRDGWHVTDVAVCRAGDGRES